MAGVKEIYDSTIRPLPPRERLEVAAMILKDLAAPEAGEIEFEDNWSDEDLRDLLNHTMATAQKRFPESEDIDQGR